MLQPSIQSAHAHPEPEERAVKREHRVPHRELGCGVALDVRPAPEHRHETEEPELRREPTDVVLGGWLLHVLGPSSELEADDDGPPVPRIDLAYRGPDIRSHDLDLVGTGRQPRAQRRQAHGVPIDRDGRARWRRRDDEHGAPLLDLVEQALALGAIRVSEVLRVEVGLEGAARAIGVLELELAARDVP